MAFENFPYTNFHEINLDWILERVKEAYSASNPPDYPVKSVNGMTGDVIIAIPANLVSSVNGETGDVVLYRNPLTQFPATDEQRWNLFRICDGDERGIEFDEDGAHRIEGTRRILIYDEENQPNYPVTSVNGQTGDVRISAGVNSVNGQTGNVVTPFINPNADILTLDSNSNTVLWGISRNVTGGNIALYISSGAGSPQAFIRYIPKEGQAINLPLLSSADIPEDSGVVSVNGKSGVVRLYGSDILISETDAETITEKLNNITNIISTIKTITYAPELIANSYVSGSNGEFLAYDGWSRTDYIDCEGHTQVQTVKSAFGGGNYNAFYDENKVFISSFSALTGTRIIDIPANAKYVAFSDITSAMSSMEIAFLPTIESKVNNYDQQISALQTSNNTQDQQISALQTANDTQDQQISALQTDNDTQDQQISNLQSADTIQAQQISALQAADTTHNQQISELQSNNAAHNQQISAIQAVDTAQNQQIAELYTRAGVYVVSIPNANTLPLRYPASGTDEKIKATNKVVSMDLSIPGTQVYNWTVTTYDGYLEIIGTMNGTSDITLYLA